MWGVELGQDAEIGRPRRADEAGGIHHALNRGNARSAIFHKPEDYEAFERILAEGLTRYACRILAYRLMPNHWHFVLQPMEDGGMSNLLGWVSLTHTMRLHAHYRTGGQGHVYPGRFKSFPVPSRMMSNFCWSADTSSATPCGPDSSDEPRTGDGVR